MINNRNVNAGPVFGLSVVKSLDSLINLCVSTFPAEISMRVGN